MDKVVGSLSEAVQDICDGAVIMVAGFGSGVPYNLEEALVQKGVKELTIISNGFSALQSLFLAGMIKKSISSFAAYPFDPALQQRIQEQVLRGEIEIEISPQGTLAERIRAGGAGIPAFYTPTGVGTLLGEGKEVRVFEGREYILETALTADFALLKAAEADKWGNLTYRMTMRNYNPIMAAAAKVTIVEVDEIVEVGELDPEEVGTPGIYVDRVVRAPKRYTWRRGEMHRR